ncbi:unnamed protein product [Alternaria alternata]
MSAYNTITLTPYEKATFCSVIEHDKLARHCPLDNGRHALELDYATAPDLGSLSRLPAELMEQVVLELDLAMRMSEHTEENEKPLEKEVPVYKVRMDKCIGFVEVGVLERRGRGIEGVPGKGINDGDLDILWAGGSAWE